MFRSLLYIFLLCILVQSCTIQKRRYLKGFHVQRWQAFNFSGHKGETGLQDEKYLKDDEMDQAKETENNDDSLKAVMVLSNITREKYHADRDEEQHVFSVHETEIQKTLQDFPVNGNEKMNQPLIPDGKQTKNGIISRDQKDMRDGLMLAILLVAVIFPPLFLFLGDPLWASILSAAICIAVDVMLIIFVPWVWLIVLSILAWHLLYSFFFFIIFNP